MRTDTQDIHPARLLALVSELEAKVISNRKRRTACGHPSISRARLLSFTYGNEFQIHRVIKSRVSVAQGQQSLLARILLQSVLHFRRAIRIIAVHAKLEYGRAG